MKKMYVLVDRKSAGGVLKAEQTALLMIDVEQENILLQ